MHCSKVGCFAGGCHDPFPIPDFPRCAHRRRNPTRWLRRLPGFPCLCAGVHAGTGQFCPEGGPPSGLGPRLRDARHQQPGMPAAFAACCHRAADAAPRGEPVLVLSRTTERLAPASLLQSSGVGPYALETSPPREPAVGSCALAREHWLRIVCVPAAFLAGCAPVPTRPEPSTVGCAAAIVRERLPGDLHDKQQHCVAAGLIALHCSRTEAWMTALGKEIGDLFGRGDAEWADWQADRAGLRCAASGATDAEILSCCSGYRGRTIGTEAHGEAIR